MRGALPLPLLVPLALLAGCAELAEPPFAPEWPPDACGPPRPNVTLRFANASEPLREAWLVSHADIRDEGRALRAMLSCAARGPVAVLAVEGPGAAAGPVPPQTYDEVRLLFPSHILRVAVEAAVEADGELAVQLGGATPSATWRGQVVTRPGHEVRQPGELSPSADTFKGPLGAEGHTFGWNVTSPWNRGVRMLLEWDYENVGWTEGAAVQARVLDEAGRVAANATLRMGDPSEGLPQVALAPGPWRLVLEANPAARALPVQAEVRFDY